jgi:alpha-L-rhamnosidase
VRGERALRQSPTRLGQSPTQPGQAPIRTLGRRGFSAVVAAVFVFASAGAPSRAAQTPPDPLQCGGWAAQVVGPTTRDVRPVRAHWFDGDELNPTDLEKLLQTDSSPLRLSQPGHGLVLDFGEVVSGKVELDTLAGSGAAVTIATSESLGFLAPGGDTQVYGNGDIVHRPGHATESWHAAMRRTFRYVLLTLPDAGWIDLDRVGVYFTAALGPASAFKGWFLSSDPLLNSIWYRSAYTLQLVSAPGTSTGLDGTLEVWRNQLDVAAPFGSRVLLTRSGAGWHDYTFDFDVTIASGGNGVGWTVRASPESFTAFRLALAKDDQPARLQTWLGTNSGPAALHTTLRLESDLRSGRAYHVRVDVAGERVVTSIDGQVVSTDALPGSSQGRVGFWAATGDQFSVGHPRVFGADGSLLLEDRFDKPYLDPTRWDGAPQPMLLDGAKRDRALGVADLAIASQADYVSFDRADRTRDLLLSVGAHQYADGKLPGGMVGNAAFAPESADLPDYTFWWVLAVGDYVRQTGDVSALRDLFPHVQAALGWAERFRRPDGLLPKGPGIDWYWTAARGTGPTTALNALYAGSLDAAADLAEILGLHDQRERYAHQAGDVRAAINAGLWDGSVGAYVDGDLRDHHPLDGNALAVKFGVASDDQAGQVLAFLRANLWTPAGTLAADRPYGAWAQDGAVWPAYVYPEVEARFSHGDDAAALDLLRRTWGGMLAHDPSSTMWEYAMHDGTIHDGSTSLAHGWSTGALPALTDWVLGVRPTRPGYVEYSLAPHPGDVTWACGAVPTPQGTLRAAWQQTDDRFTLRVDAPSGTTGHLAIPWRTADSVLLDDQPVSVAVGPDGSLAFDGLPPGVHTFEARRGPPPTDN